MINAVFDGGHAADAGADDHGGAGAGDVLAAEAGLRHRFICGDDRELRKRIAERQHLALDMRGRIEIRHLGGDLDAPVIGALGFQWPDLRDAVAGGGP